MVLPTAYLCGKSYFSLLLASDCEIEVMESFEKQTFRNRCTLIGKDGREIRLTVPVKQSDHKQLTKDVEISYQERWQHQHWLALCSAYEHAPYFLYYADFLRPWYEKKIKWLVDFNDVLTDIICRLINNTPPKEYFTKEAQRQTHLQHTADWSGEKWTDRHPWQKETSIVDSLFKSGRDLQL